MANVQQLIECVRRTAASLGSDRRNRLVSVVFFYEKSNFF